METIKFIYNDNQVEFQPIGMDNVMVNATQMAKIFGKQVNEFLSNQNTKSFIEICLKNGNSRYLNIENEEDLYRSNQKSGTFMHRILALKFAAWLNPRFELWVYSTIEKLLFGKHVEREQSLERTVALKSEMLELTGKPDKTGEDFQRYLTVEQELKREQALRQQLTREAVTEMQSLFLED